MKIPQLLWATLLGLVAAAPGGLRRDQSASLIAPASDGLPADRSEHTSHPVEHSSSNLGSVEKKAQTLLHMPIHALFAAKQVAFRLVRKAEGKSDPVVGHDDTKKVAKDTEEGEVQEEGMGGYVVQLIFAIFYYFLVVRNYPELERKGNREAKGVNEARDLKHMMEPMAMVHASFPNCLTSFCCQPARAAHTFSVARIMPYWAGFISMLCCPCLTLCFVHAFGGLNEELEGHKSDPISSCLCSWCCSCCVIAQDAEALDALTDSKTQCCWVKKGRH